MGYPNEPAKGSLAPSILPTFGGDSSLVLSGLFKSLAPNVRDRYYKGETLALDGYTFTNCCFHNCTLITNTGVFVIASCTVIDCVFQFGDNAVRIIRLFNYLNGPSRQSVFNPEVASDGAATIK